MSSARLQVTPSAGPIVRFGHLRKLKTLKKKFFVLRGDAPGSSACLEYYDSKKKFNNRQPPKRSISMRSCFNINRRVDTKHANVIALYTKDECFSLILDTEKDLEEWLNAMLLLAGDVPDGEQPRPTFEHVWQVTMQKKGLGERKNIHGLYRLCLTDRTLSLVKVGANDNIDPIEFSLICIRRCGYMERIFYMEVGRSAVTGGGDFWMEAEDNNIAHNMHAAILNAMSSSSSSTSGNNSNSNSVNAGTSGSIGNKDDVGPRQRFRSSSANEASKPISVLQRRHTGAKLHGFSPLGATGRDRCDSLPSRARTTSEGYPTPVVLGHPRGGHLAPHVPRPHSMYGRGLSYSPPVSSMLISPASGACSTDSAGSSLSMDDGPENILEESSTLSRYGHSLTPDEPAILEENIDDYVLWTAGHQPHKYSPNFKSHSPSQQSSYVEMYSPCGSSSGRSGSMSAAYMPMSPATGAIPSSQHHHHNNQQQQQQQSQHSHSRGSSLVEETTLSDGYVPMAPVGDDGYVDMDPLNPSHHHHNGHFPDDMSQHGGSSCSVTSGTPSTDLRFSEYHLDKVTSYLVTGDETPSSRPIRAYSVGSRPEPTNRHRRNRLDIAQQEASRVRAFSVGSRSKRPEIIGRLASVIAARLPGASNNDSTNSNKSNSAPLLSSSWGHNSACSANSDRMEDLMELDFTKPTAARGNFNSPPANVRNYGQTQSQCYNNATVTSSYVDMSPGQNHGSGTTTTAPYVDMSGINKMIRNNSNNNNNNANTANHNHNHVHATSSVASMTYKPIIKTLRPVEEGTYMRMESSPEDWPRAGSSPKQAPSPMQDDYMQMNGPPGVTRTAPVDLPQPRRPPDGYVEMSFKSRPSLEQDYINMSLGNSSNPVNSSQSSGNRTRTRRLRESNRHCEKSQRSKPIAIQASTKTSMTPNFLPLNGDSPTSESLASTPASPPRATPTGSTATIFPFSLNSPQSPIKPFEAAGGTMAGTTRRDDNSEIILSTNDYSTKDVEKTSENGDSTKNLGKNCVEGSQSPLTKRLAELTILRTKSARTQSNPSTTTSCDENSDGSKKSNDEIVVVSEMENSRLSNNEDSENREIVSSQTSNPTTINNSRGNFSKDDNNSSTFVNREDAIVSDISSEETPKSPLSVRIVDSGISKTKNLQLSPILNNSTNSTNSSGFKIVQKISSVGKMLGEENCAAVGNVGTNASAPTVAVAATTSSVDSEGYEKLQPGASILHYASLDLPEVGTAGPVSPTPVIDGFTYAEIDFAKLKQN